MRLPSLRITFTVPLLLLLPLAISSQPKKGGPLEQQLLKEGPASLAKAARAQGDPQRGAVLFHQAQLSCTKCHSAGAAEVESPLGPDLSRPEPGTVAEAIVESVLNPSKHIRKGFEAVTINKTDGNVVTGLLVDERNGSLLLRDATNPDKPVEIAKADIEERKTSTVSLMPSGLANQLGDRREFLDLAAYLIECAEFGPARARSLRPDESIINPPLPAYEADLDHAGLITGWDAGAFKRGESTYTLVCASCHGTKEQPGSMPTSLRFAEGKFRFGNEPQAMYRTLTHGNGMMAAQSMLVPRQKYDVIHYIREAFLKPHNPTQYAAVDVAALPKGKSRGPTPPEGQPWLRRDYGPTLTGTFEIAQGNIAYKGVAVRLDPGPGGISKGKAWSVFEHDTLRMAAGWTGEGFIDWNGINFNGRHEIHPRIVGKVEFANGDGPGWAHPETGSFDDPRVKGRDGKPYGPLPREWGKYKGQYRAGDRITVSYTVGATTVLESPGWKDGAFTRSFEIGPRAKAMKLKVLRHPDGKAVALGDVGTAAVSFPGGAAGVIGNSSGMSWSMAGDGHLLLAIPAGDKTLRFTLWMGKEPMDAHTGEAFPLAGKPLWNKPLAGKLERGKDDGPFAADAFTPPAPMRFTGLDFLPGGKELLACTWDGDIWRVAGIDKPEQSWTRITGGLFQPLGIKIVDGNVYVTCRDQIVRLRDLNGDGETDYFECFNSDHIITESFHEFAMGLQTDAAGNFYYTKGARHGKSAIVPHHGTLLKVSKDGLKTEIVASGFRAPNGVCVNADGTFFVTDQEGHWMPKNRVNWVRPGNRFFGNMMGFTDVTDRSDSAQEEPLCWITNRFDRSPAELLRVESKAWGGMDGALLNLSYGTGKVYVVPHEKTGDGMQGGMAVLPLPPFPTGVMRGRFNPTDGHLYLCGMYAWAGNQQAPGGLYRIRATGKPLNQPLVFHATKDGLALTFSDSIHADSAKDPTQFGLKVWDLLRSERYGSAHLNEHALKVTAVKLSDDRKTLTLTIPDLKPTRGLELWYSVKGADGKEVDGLLHGTVHRMGE